MKKATSSKNYLGMLTGLVIGGIQHYYYMKKATSVEMIWYTFKPVAVTLDRINRR